MDDDELYLEPTIEGVGMVAPLYDYVEEKNMQEVKPVDCKGHTIRIKLWFKEKPIAQFMGITSIAIMKHKMDYGFTARKGDSCDLYFKNIAGDEYEICCAKHTDYECVVEEKNQQPMAYTHCYWRAQRIW